MGKIGHLLLFSRAVEGVPVASESWAQVPVAAQSAVWPLYAQDLYIASRCAGAEGQTIVKALIILNLLFDYFEFCRSDLDAVYVLAI